VTQRARGLYLQNPDLICLKKSPTDPLFRVQFFFSVKNPETITADAATTVSLNCANACAYSLKKCIPSSAPAFPRLSQLTTSTAPHVRLRYSPAARSTPFTAMQAIPKSSIAFWCSSRGIFTCFNSPRISPQSVSPGQPVCNRFRSRSTVNLFRVSSVVRSSPPTAASAHSI